MRIVGVSNNQDVLLQLQNFIHELYPNCDVDLYTDPMLSAKFICNNKTDLVIMDVAMRPVDGFDLIRVLKRQKPELFMIMMSDSSAYREFAFKLQVDGYLIRPFAEKSKIILRTLLEKES